jgi:hypothetical protein
VGFHGGDTGGEAAGARYIGTRLLVYHLLEVSFGGHNVEVIGTNLAQKR